MDILKFVDDSKIIAEVNDENDIKILQLNLEKIYSWADKNHIKWNAKKFQLLRVAPNNDLKDDTYIFTPNYNEVIEAKNDVKDFGILIDDTLLYKNQQMAAVKKAQQKSAWIFRTFGTRNIEFF